MILYRDQYISIIIINTDIDDFGGKVVSKIITRYGNEYLTSDGCFITNIPINNDNINEADQVFVITLNLPNDLENQFERYVTLSRNVSIGYIMDDDRKFAILCAWLIIIHFIHYNSAINFSFEEPSYTFIEPPFRDYRILFLNKDRETEQTFCVSFKDRSYNISDHYQPATLDKDFERIFSASMNFLFLTSEQNIPYLFVLLHDNITEDTEAFIISAEIWEYTDSLNYTVESNIIIVDSQSKFIPSLKTHNVCACVY